MAWSNSKMHAPFVLGNIDGSVAFDLDADSIKVALFNNTITPDNSVLLAASGYNAGVWLAAAEVSDAAEWPATGEILANASVAQSGTTITFDADDVVSTGSSATLADVHGGLVYDDTIAADPGICYNYFGGAQTVTDGVMTIQWAGAGIASFSVA